MQMTPVQGVMVDNGAIKECGRKRIPKEYEYVDPDRYREAADPGLSRRPRRSFSSGSRVSTERCLSGKWIGKGFDMCAGFSGLGFKLGSAIGERMAQEIPDGEA